MTHTSVLWKSNWPPPCTTHDPEVCCSTCHPVMFSTSYEEGMLYYYEAKAQHPKPYSDKNTVGELSEALLVYKYWYYKGEPIVIDFEYDRTENRLRELDPNNKALTQVGTGE